MSIAQNLALIKGQIHEAATRAGRDPAGVTLVAVSKTKPAALVAEALAAGQTVFGENYVQESSEKIPALGPGPQWHFIGHLQTNKAKVAAGLFGWVQTLDRPKLIKALDRHAGQADKVIQVLIQVNVGGEDQKAGCTPAEAPALAQAAARAPNLKLRGLMTMPPFFDQPERVRPLFAELRRLAETLGRDLDPGSMDHLSMGMSGDFAAAIAEGATLVRVGTAIFGHR